ncbi:cation:proton antiporter domain-containing protein [Arthrobacter sp. RHLT1-20]
MPAARKRTAPEPPAAPPATDPSFRQHPGPGSPPRQERPDQHSFVEQIERLLTVAILVLLGGAIARGLFAGVGGPEIALALTFLLVIRPLTGWLGLLGGRTGPRERSVIAVFGVRGIGTLFYIAYALRVGSFADDQRLWAIAGLIVTASIILHGISATPVMAFLDNRRNKAAAKTTGDQRNAPTTAV